VKVSIRLAEERDVPELTRLIELSVRGLQAGDYSPAQLERALAVVYGVDTRLIADGTYFVAVGRGSKAMDDRVIGSSGDRVIEGLDDRANSPSAPLEFPTSAAKAARQEMASIAALKRCATQNQATGGNQSTARDRREDERRDLNDRLIGSSVIVGCGGWSRRRTLYWGDQFAGREDSLLDPKTEAAKIRAFFVHPEWARRGIGGMILDACEKAAIAEGFRRLEMGATLTGVPFYRVKGYVELERVEAPLGDGLTLPIVRMGKTVGSC